MEKPSDTPDLSFDAERMRALELRLAALQADNRDLQRLVAGQQEEIVAAKELAVHVARMELEHAEQALEIERLRERLRQRPTGRDEAEEDPVRMVTSLRPAAAPRQLGVPELRWTAEVIVRE